ncbi:MAG TPA: AAA family ATPase [Candidatus Treponema faecavium]|nr:AAA family ATPase [Candidatus Treponema faecavium]
MRPHLLVLQNIGPFKQKTTVDFDSLGDFFLIYGSTGAGKTTLFDAITYALYGRLPGARTKLSAKQLRSDFAESDAQASVQLTFSVQNDYWRITRVLPQDAVTASGRQTEKKTDPLLEHRDGQEWIVSSEKKTETDAQLQELIGLTAQEFSCIVLLPQGEFAEFLRQNSTQRQTTLAKLFPLEQYQALMERAKDLYTHKSGALSQTADDLKALRKELDALGADKRIEELRSRAVEYTAACRTQRAEQTAAALRQSDTQRRLEKCRQTAAHRNRLAVLEAQTADIEYERARLASAEQAAVIEAYITQEETEAAKSAQIAAALERLHAQLERAQTHRQRLHEQEAGIQLKQQELQQIAVLLHTGADAAAAEQELLRTQKEEQTVSRQLAHKQEQLAQIAAQRGAIQQELDETPYDNAGLISAQQEVMDAHAACTQAERQHEKALEVQKAQALFEQAEQELADARENEQAAKTQHEQAQILLEQLREEQRRQEREAMAAELARQLHGGAPCPVCGSLQHPKPAALQPHTAAAAEELARAQKTAARCEAAYTEAAQRRAVAESRARERQNDPLLAAGCSVSGTEPALLRAKEALSQAEERQAALSRQTARRDALMQQDAAMRQQAEACKEAIHALSLQLSDISHKHEQQQDAVQTFAERGAALLAASVQSASDTFSALSQKKQALKRETDAFTAELKDCETACTRLAAEYDSAAAQQREQELAYEQVHGTLEAQLAPAGFASIEEARAAFVPEAERRRIRETITAWQKEHDLLTALLAQPDTPAPAEQRELESALAGIEEQLAQLEASLAELEAAAADCQRELSVLTEKQERADRLEQQRQLQEKESQAYKQLSHDLNGKNPSSIPFNAWVLGMYLEQIVQAANLRLSRISDGRFTLLTNAHKSGAGLKGLDLQVFDSYTGKNRPCETLSGGETFMASISLALGLTDIVQNKKGGISLDALFIDEGFGSLDETSLEKALSILDSIRDHRCVGIISHVGILKNSIPSSLEVIKEPSGSSVRHHQAEDV